jgi:hypothetical protein
MVQKFGDKGALEVSQIRSWWGTYKQKSADEKARAALRQQWQQASTVAQRDMEAHLHAECDRPEAELREERAAAAATDRDQMAADSAPMAADSAPMAADSAPMAADSAPMAAPMAADSAPMAAPMAADSAPMAEDSESAVMAANSAPMAADPAQMAHHDGTTSPPKRKRDASIHLRSKKTRTVAESNKRAAARILARVPLFHQPEVCSGKRKRTEHNYHAMVNNKQ